MSEAVEPFADELGNQMVRLQRIRDRTVAQIAALSRDELDIAAYTCLFRLLSDGPMRSGALADAMYSDPSTVSRQIASLVDRGLVERLADPADGRASVLAVTSSGRDLVEHMRKRRTANLGLVIAEWSNPDRREFVRLLGQFVDDYERRRPEMIAAIRSATLPTTEPTTETRDRS